MTSSVAAECVVLLHGLNRSDSSMRAIERALEREGYRVINHNYDTGAKPIWDLGSDVTKIVETCGDQRVNFVTHSLGGIVVRAYLAQHRPANLGRTVMLSPPNHGSEVVDKLGKLKLFEIINGSAGVELTTNASSTPNQLGPADFELGIIAGNKFINPVFAAMIEKPNDGAVSVRSTKLEGMKDHIVLPVNHSFMMFNSEVIRQIKAFLMTGSFER